MLQLKNMKKSYTVAGFTQNALDGVSVSFRNNEFAAVLGPSGSGKTTMLNITGGLDRYDSGELIIDGISTNNYKASDWDTYRNNRIGFVFQNYNLIPHQNVLANVELALTLSGVTKSERRRRAKEALEEVGLGEHMRKKPNQLSGGQMQRVAIARALINNPEILLADEPTGALDSTTGKQVMELLTEIAKDRLVIMVTHNNELAEEYANRIIYLKDGKIVSDSRPFDPETEPQREPTPIRRAAMSFFTAVALSFSNLMTKKGRTFTTAFAGSIGIIGVATILAFSNGINTYIKNIEEETLSNYPLTIERQGFDISSIFMDDDEGEEQQREARRAPVERPPDTVRELHVLEIMFSTQTLNELSALKEHFDSNKEVLQPHVTTIHYKYSIVPQIYMADTSDGIEQLNPDSIFNGIMGMGDTGMPAGMGQMTSFMPAMDVFSELPNDPQLYEEQYEVVTGRWPENYDEAVLVLLNGANIMDFTMYSIGLRDRDELRAMMESVMQGEDMNIEIAESEGFYTYDDLMSVGFKVVNPAELYQYDELYDVWVDKSGDAEYMKTLISQSMDLKIVGLVKPAEDATTTILTSGVNYMPELILHLMESASENELVRKQMENPEVNVISGKTFAYEQDNPESTFDFSKIISADEDMIREAMQLDSFSEAFEFDGMDFSDVDTSGFDMSGLDMSGFDMSSLDMSGFDMSDIDLGLPDFDGIDFSSIDMNDIDFSLSETPISEVDFSGLTEALSSLLDVPLSVVNGIIIAIVSDFITDNSGIFTSPLNIEGIMNEFSSYLNSPDVQEYISDELSPYIDTTAIEDDIADVLQTYINDVSEEYMAQIASMTDEQINAISERITEQLRAAISDTMAGIQTEMQGSVDQMTRQISRQISSSMETVMKQIEESIQKVFEDLAAEMEAAMEGIDGEALAEAFQISISEDAVYELMTSIMNPTTTSYEQNLSLLGYADPKIPTQILIYPRSFESKQTVLDFLDDYNQLMEDTNQPEKAVYFTDIVGLMMSTVTDIVDLVSYALVAFVSVALVVSSIMIGVITFVSVLERKKEIGILRAVGASKGNIRLVFNAETLIIGFVAGVIGVIATYFIAIVANAILFDLVEINNLVLMPPVVPIILVGISMFLTYIAGLLPASAAAAKPPVEALRSE